MNCDRGIWPRLTALLGSALTFNVALAPLCTFGVGGRARAMACLETEVQAAEVRRLAAAEGLPVLILGGGSNLFFVDDFQGLILKLGSGFKKIQRLEGDRVQVGSAVASSVLLKAALGWSLSGLEGLAGIPGSVGGALMMNAGSGGSSIGETVESLDCLDAQGCRLSFKARDLVFSYRHLAGLPAGSLISSARLKLKEAEREQIKSDLFCRFQARRFSQPKGVKSAGCVFKNPAGDSAGRLIDLCGLKGSRVGGCEVSQIHANFIINRGGASGRDIVELIRHVIQVVYERYGLLLEPEVKIIGPGGEVTIDDI